MDIYVIGVIKDNSNKTIGYRMLTLDGKTSTVTNAPADNVKQVILSGKAVVKNLAVDSGGGLVGTNGQLSRYPQLGIDGKLLTPDSSLIIINQIGDVGYTVCNYLGEVKKAPNAAVIEYGNNAGIANGKVGSKNGIEFVSSIAGEYDFIPSTAAKSGVNTDRSLIGKTIGIPIPSVGKSSTAKNTGIDVSNAINENDVFKSMTPQQKQALKNYYTWYTMRVYKSLSRDIRLKVAVSKVENLAHLRGVKDWQFAGVWDTGIMGGSHCELGHALRYEYYAAPVETAHDKDTYIVFGSRCASDFFEISPENMKHLEKAANIMSTEVALMSEIISNGLESDYCMKLELLYDILKQLETRENLEKVFSKELAGYMVAFIGTGMPLMQSMVKLATKEICRDIPGFYATVFPKSDYSVRSLLWEDTAAPSVDNQYTKWTREYLRFVASNKIEGEYAYNPLSKERNHKDEGRYNSEARDKRNSLLRGIRNGALCSKFDIGELTMCVETIHRFNEIYKEFQNEADRRLGVSSHDALWGAIDQLSTSKLHNIKAAASKETLIGLNTLRCALICNKEHSVRYSKPDRIDSHGRAMYCVDMAALHSVAIISGTPLLLGMDLAIAGHLKMREYKKEENDRILKAEADRAEAARAAAEEKELKEKAALEAESIKSKEKLEKLEGEALEELSETMELCGKQSVIDIVTSEVGPENEWLDSEIDKALRQAVKFKAYATVLASDKLGELEDSGLKLSEDSELVIDTSNNSDTCKDVVRASIPEIIKQIEALKQGARWTKPRGNTGINKTLEALEATSENADVDTNIDRLQETAALIQLAGEKVYSDDYGAKIVLDMARRGMDYKKCSSAQRFWVDTCFKKYGIGLSDDADTSVSTETTTTGSQKAREAKVNNKHPLKDNPDIQKKVDTLISQADSVPMQAVLAKSPNTLKICYTILSTGVASDRQLKYVDEAYKELQSQ